MEETLHLILQELRGLKEGQQRLETRMGRFEDRMDSLEARMDRIEARMDSIEARMDSLEARMDSLETKVDKLDVELQEVKRLARGTFEQVGRLTEFRTETIATLARHDKIIGTLAARTL